MRTAMRHATCNMARYVTRNFDTYVTVSVTQQHMQAYMRYALW